MYTITTLRPLVPTTTTSAKALPYNSFMQLYKCIHYWFAMFIRIIGSWKDKQVKFIFKTFKCPKQHTSSRNNSVISCSTVTHGRILLSPPFLTQITTGYGPRTTLRSRTRLSVIKENLRKMATDSGTTVKFEGLGKTNFDTWKIHMMAQLTIKKLLKYVDGRLKRPKENAADPAVVKSVKNGTKTTKLPKQQFC
uniref:Uncharacterized protein n=1 Tax=Strigamia maritima TaxID=126957 RepID=T1J2U7_STRMM